MDVDQISNLLARKEKQVKTRKPRATSLEKQFAETDTVERARNWYSFKHSSQHVCDTCHGTKSTTVMCAPTPDGKWICRICFLGS